MNGPGRQLQATPSLRETQPQPHSQVSAGQGLEGKYIYYFIQPQTKVIIFSFPNNSFSLSHEHKSSAKSFICPSLFTSHTQLSQVWPISSHPSLESSLNWTACLPGHRPYKDSLNRSLVSPFPSEQYVRPPLSCVPWRDPYCPLRISPASVLSCRWTGHFLPSTHVTLHLPAQTRPLLSLVLQPLQILTL